MSGRAAQPEHRNIFPSDLAVTTERYIPALIPAASANTDLTVAGGDGSARRG